ncbi:MAG: hypothetical protein PHR82_08105 [Endomicrobiaceae bacterium]|nr:hypothetical protein [Endomicrobiaceae bacterium]
MSTIDFIIHCFIFSIPGIVGVELFYYLNPHKERHYYFEIFKILLLSTFVFFIIELIAFIKYKNISQSISSPIDVISIIKNNINIDIHLLLLASFVSIIFSFIFTWMHQSNILFKIANTLNITTRISNQDVWEHFMHQLNTQVILRDFTTNLIYEGEVSGYSDVGEVREILLTNVKIFKSDFKTKICNRDSIYLARRYNEFIIEKEPIKSK